MEILRIAEPVTKMKSSKTHVSAKKTLFLSFSLTERLDLEIRAVS